MLSNVVSFPCHIRKVTACCITSPPGRQAIDDEARILSTLVLLQIHFIGDGYGVYGCIGSFRRNPR
jgi:hypothetical protein